MSNERKSLETLEIWRMSRRCRRAKTCADTPHQFCAIEELCDEITSEMTSRGIPGNDDSSPTYSGSGTTTGCFLDFLAFLAGGATGIERNQPRVRFDARSANSVSARVKLRREVQKEYGRMLRLTERARRTSRRLESGRNLFILFVHVDITIYLLILARRRARSFCTTTHRS